MIPGRLPRGIWYEADRERYRIRLYRNKVPYLEYCKSLPDAEEALRRMRERIGRIKKQRHNVAQQVPCATFRDIASSVRTDRDRDPREYRKH